MAQIRSKPFGVTKQGANVTEYILSNPGGLTVSVLDYGCIIKNIIVPAKNGPVDVVLGHDTMADYEDDFTSSSSTCCGAFVGRYANRIENATFSVGGKTYQLEANNGPNHLHGCFSRKLYRVKSFGDTLLMEAESPDGEDGFPGSLKLAVRYTLTEDNAFRMDYRVSSDADTIVNLTNHSYFNLAGHDAGSIENQTLVLKAEQFSPVIDSASIPTGEHAPVQGTPMDFTSEKAIGAEIEADFEQLKLTGGYDHNFILDKAVEGSIELMAVASCKESGITMEAFTDLPCVQFYAGNFIAPVTGKNGVFYDKRNGFCLESQYVPNAINQEGEEKPILEAGDTYDTTTVYKFIF